MEKKIIHSINRWLSPTSYWVLEQIQVLSAQYLQEVYTNELLTDYPKDFPVFEMKSGKHNWLQKTYFKLQKAQDRNRFFQANSQQKKETILFSHFGNRGFNDCFLGFKAHVVRFYGYDVGRLINEDAAWKSKYKILFEEANAFLAEGPFMKSELIKLGCPQQKIHVLPLGVSEQMNLPKEQLDNKVLNVLFAGTFKAKKGLLIALRTIFYLAENKDDIHFHLVGSVSNFTKNEQEYTEQILPLIQKLKEQKKLTEYGFVSKEKLLQIAVSCHVALQPSVTAIDGDSEGGYPLTFLEIMQTGTPIISTHHADIPFIIKEGINGFLVKEPTVEMLSKALLNFWENHAFQMRESTKNSVRPFYWSELKAQYHTIFEAW